MDKDDIKKRIFEDEDFIRSSKFNNSLSYLLNKNDSDLDDKTIAKMLMMSDEEFVKIYQELLDKLRKDISDEQ